MTEADLIGKLRGEIGDNVEPYKIPPERLNDVIADAVSDYSRHRPRTKKGTITLVPGIAEYPLADDCQTWLAGLEGYEVFDNVLHLETAAAAPGTITYTYLGDHTLGTIPARDVQLLVDYCMWKLLSDIVREGAEISGLKLGKGLEIKFDNFAEITKLANQRLENYQRNIRRVVGGCT